MGEGNDFVNLLIWPAAERLLDPRGGERILDIACGNGLTSRRLAAAGADVVAFDFSEEMIAIARERAHADRIAYSVLDATDYDALVALGEGRFDAALCNMALFDIADVDPLVAAVAKLLRPGGRFVFSLLHPCFPGWGDDAPSSWPPGESYFKERWWLARNSGVRGKVGSTHRMLSTYLNVLSENGLAIDRVLEPRPDPDWVRRKKPSADLVPVFLVARCRRVAG
jgi:SAM-dependent methyltransferase